jgi:hypothetical protein
MPGKSLSLLLIAVLLGCSGDAGGPAKMSERPVVAGPVSQAPDLPPFITEHANTATFYYQSPRPELGPRLLAELLDEENLEHPWFEENDQVLLLVGAQLGDIGAGKPKITRDYEAAFADAPLAGRRVILRSLMNCGDDETVKRVGDWLEDPRHADVRPELEALKTHLQDPQRQHVRDRAAREPKDLDLLWANFFVTGDYAPVSRILDVFDLPDSEESEALEHAARWSLGSNLQQHPKLVELLLEHAQDRPEGSRKVIGELVLTFPEQGQE